MTKTLADMTTEQRANCIGMWCEYPSAYGRLGIIYDLDDGSDPWILRFDVRTEILGYDAKDVIPRFDLPRAWSPDGTPPAGEWEYAEYLGDYKGMTNVYHYDGEPTHRHFVGEWEEA
ncbi:TPA: hypothetical protein I8W35_002307 [Corynebacterium striatum]|nr:hypothetical protein [Corynebacterium striatum]HAT1405391.1 hypothetical protein [Corynebacterium striatum]